MTGTVYALGVGPGDPELITLKALRLLRAAALVVWPAPETGESLTRAIVAPHLEPGREEMAVRIPVTAARFPADVYDRAADRIAARAGAGGDVAVLCEGDPFLYGSFMYLFARLAGRVRVEVVPGVSSVTACAARAGAPLAASNDVLSVIPAGLDEDDLARRVAAADAVAIVKLGRHAAKVRRALDALGLTAHARYIEHGTMANERISSFAEADTARAPYFSMVLAHRRGAAWRRARR